MLFSSIDSLLTQPHVPLSQDEKEALLLPLFKELTAYHKKACPAYERIIDIAFMKHEKASCMAEIPFLPLSLFKHRSLRSIPDENVRVSLQSSGTTGSKKSQIDMDTTNAKMAAAALATTLRAAIGNKRLPMLIIDSPSSLHGENALGARASAILGLMPFGCDHTFVLRNDMSLDFEALEDFLLRHEGQPFLIYGFTFLLWQKFLPACEKHGFDLSLATMLHSGGWKNLHREYIDNTTFKNKFEHASGLRRVMNFYGMAETPGMIFIEQADGLLHLPVFADVIIRDPVHFRPVEDDSPGIIQVLNLVPRSYPGHSLLTEDVGIIEMITNPETGKTEKTVRFLGRVPKASLRGCSNVMAEESSVASPKAA